MPRQRRALAESKTYHIMVRGNERKKLFIDDEDKLRFMEILCEKNKEKKFEVLAYCIMDNHVHLLINEGGDQIARIMKRINVSYAYYFNKKYNRVGHLFQDRFKSEVIDSDSYLLSAARYIHRNPVKAFITSEVSQYKWSSYSSYINQSKYSNSIVHMDEILEMFSLNRQRAIELFIEYTNKDSEEQFIDYHEDLQQQERTILNERDAVTVINEYLHSKGIAQNDLKKRSCINQRNELIHNLKTCSNLSNRELGRILNLDRNTIQRVN